MSLSGFQVVLLLANCGQTVMQLILQPIAFMYDRASMLWQKIQPGALDKIMDMVARCPELKGEVRVPRKRPLLWDAAPNGFVQSLKLVPALVH